MFRQGGNRKPVILSTAPGYTAKSTSAADAVTVDFAQESGSFSEGYEVTANNSVSAISFISSGDGIFDLISAEARTIYVRASTDAGGAPANVWTAVTIQSKNFNAVGHGYRRDN